MPNFIIRIFDKCVFTLTFIIGVQLPEFMQQYIQRLSGHLNEASFQLQQFQYIANSQYQGSLLALIEKYQANSDRAIQQTGDLISNLLQRTQYLELQLSQLQQGEYLERLLYFIREVDLELAKATLEQFQLAIPLEPNALVTGLCFALAISLLQSIGYHGGHWLLVRITHKKIDQRSVI